jgi:hypothetical protein
MTTLKAALSDILSGTPADIHRAADLERALGLPATLSWQIFRVVHEPSVIAAGAYVPKAKAMQRFLRAARKCASSELVDRASAAFDDFESLVKGSAGDRVSFDTIATSAMAPDEAEQQDIAQRRAAFRANSHVFGVQRKTGFRTVIVHRSSETDRNDYCMLHGLIGLRRLRYDAPRHLFSTRLEDRSKPQRFEGESLEPAATTFGAVSILERFSTRPFPRTNRSRDSQGFEHLELLDNEVGSDSSFDCVTGGVFRSIVPSPISPGEEIRDSFRLLCGAPSRVLIQDVLLYDGGSVARSFEALVRYSVSGSFEREGNLITLPQRVSVMSMGVGAKAAHTPDIPRYPEMIRWACDRLGWDSERFHVYRCRIEYPILSAQLVMSFSPPK